MIVMTAICCFSSKRLSTLNSGSKVRISASVSSIVVRSSCCPDAEYNAMVAAEFDRQQLQEEADFMNQVHQQMQTAQSDHVPV